MFEFNRLGTDLLYARVDLIPGPDRAPVVLEIELTEPCLFLRHALLDQRSDPCRLVRRVEALEFKLRCGTWDGKTFNVYPDRK